MKLSKLRKILADIPGDPQVAIRLGHRGRGELALVQDVEQYELYPGRGNNVVLSDINPDWKEEDET